MVPLYPVTENTNPMPSDMGMIAERYVSRAPRKYRGSFAPGTLVMAQLANGAQPPSKAEAERSILLVAAMATEGACCARLVNSRALMAWAMTLDDELAF